MKNNAKIVATLGPKTDNIKTLEKMIKAGMDVARLNFSHGNHGEHAQRVNNIRTLSKTLNHPITILQDLQGPKIRVGEIPGFSMELIAGEQVVLCQTDHIQKPTKIIPVQIPNIIHHIQKGSRILLDDGNLELVTTDIQQDEIVAEVVLGGKLSSHKGINFPGIYFNIPGFTEKDRADLEFGLKIGVDAVAISFVCSAIDIVSVRESILKILSDNKTNIPVIAKLERPEAIDNLDDIIQVADGVMVARGDLAVETSAAQVPIIQKRIIDRANFYSKLVITATQMLDSMINNPRPTRAEASDVANAIFDGSDAVMLSGETATGKYPVKTIETMSSIIQIAEEHISQWGYKANIRESWEEDDAVHLTRAAKELAHDRNVSFIVVFTRSGRTAQLMSKARPNVPILAFTPDEKTYQQIGMYWGTTPYLVPYTDTVEGMLSFVDNTLINNYKLSADQQIVMISGYPVGAFRAANLVLLHTIGSSEQQT